MGGAAHFLQSLFVRLGGKQGGCATGEGGAIRRFSVWRWSQQEFVFLGGNLI